MKCKRELLFFIENYTGHNNEIKEMLHRKKHARTYMNKFTINEDDQYDISKIKEMTSGWEFKAGLRPKKVQNRINDIVSRISAESLDIFLFGWYEFEGKTDHWKSENKRYNRRINISNTLTKERVYDLDFHRYKVYRLNSDFIPLMVKAPPPKSFVTKHPTFKHICK